MPLTTEQRDLIVEETRSWLRTPYHHQGAIKGAGVDCAMILIKVFNNLGLMPDIDPRPYPPDWHLHRDEERYLGWVKEYSEKVEIPLPGDIALFRFGKCISHGAIVIDYPIIIHAVRPERMVIMSDLSTSEALLERLDSFWSLKV
jgi:cell wall-associated NlpC family hydrolase